MRYESWLRKVMRKRIRQDKLAYGTILTFPYAEGKRTDRYPLVLVTEATGHQVTGADLLGMPSKEVFLAVTDEIVKARSLRELADVFMKIKKNRKLNKTVKTYLFDNMRDMAIVTRAELSELRESVDGS